MRCEKCQASLEPEATFCSDCGSPQDPLIGRRLGEKYVLLRKLGAGGFGAVYEAEERRFERKVAIKILHPRILRDPNALTRFRQEWLALSRLSHSAALRLFDVGQTEDGLVWMSTELLSGETLEELLQKTPRLELRAALDLLQPIFEVLEEAHQKGIIHRDLKPANIFIANVGDKRLAKLLDFGVAKLSSNESITQAGLSLGTPQYMAPEQWEASSSVSSSADMYSMGVIVYRLLSGRSPWVPDPNNRLSFYQTPPDDLRAVMGSDCSEALGGVVMRALSRDPAKRQRSIRELWEQLYSALPPRAVSVPPRKPPRFLLGGALLLVLGVLFFLVTPSPTPSPASSSPASLSADGALLNELRGRCDGGSAEACFNLSNNYEHGVFTTKDLSRALQLQERACALMPQVYCERLGVRFFYAMGVEVDKPRAKDLFQRGCDSGGGSACEQLAINFSEGDEEGRISLLNKGCEYKSASACWSLSNLYESKDPPNKERAAFFLKRACEMGRKDVCEPKP